MADLILAVVILAIVGSAIAYINKSRQSGSA